MLLLLRRRLKYIQLGECFQLKGMFPTDGGTFSTEGERFQLKGGGFQLKKFIHDPRGWGLAKIRPGCSTCSSTYQFMTTSIYRLEHQKN
jgi:hypothetical protein